MLLLPLTTGHFYAARTSNKENRVPAGQPAVQQGTIKGTCGLVARLDITRKQWIDHFFRSRSERKGLSYESM